MRIVSLAWNASDGWKSQESEVSSPDLILFFGSRAALSTQNLYADLRKIYPDAAIMGCSTGGQFDRTRIEDDIAFGSAIYLERSTMRLASVEIADAAGTRAAGEALGAQLSGPDLRAVLVLSDGLKVNGSALVAGITANIDPGVVLAGGLAGDGAAFEHTLVCANCSPRDGLIAAIGFYGDAISVKTGSAGGWDVFGPKRVITKSEGNVLLELDGMPALDLYERYLGEEEARALPGSGLLFPLRIDDPKIAERDVVRTLLAVDRERRSVTFAGDMPMGWSAQLMRGNFDSLSEGAADAAHQAKPDFESDGIAIMVSCIGRRLLMGQRAIDEVEAATDSLAPGMNVLGFYSYGEISPHARSGFCQLHNQTMTMMTLQERVG